MASNSQHRCVFVGNIPYDATEEQLIEICQEVGPVVSFRLVIDRETGKPKGYGFCEYKDEETALSARRNLQGYEINGRQLRVDFAENDKGTDRAREQGRGGPGLTPNVDPQNKVGGQAVHGDANNQPIGLTVAVTAAAVMAGALGGPPALLQSNQNGLQNQSALASDPMTLHLAKMSRSQLTQIISEVKGMAVQNKELAHQLLLARPQLSKALFQAQIMLGMVTPQMLEIANIRQASNHPAHPPFNQLVPVPAVRTPADLPLPTENKLQSRLIPQMHEVPLSTMSQNSLARSQFPVPRPQNMQPRMQLPQHANHNVFQSATLLGQSGIPTLSPMYPQPSSGSSIRPQTLVTNSSALNEKMQPSLLQHPGQFGTSHSSHNSQMGHPNASVQQSPLSRPFSEATFQPSPSMSKVVIESINKDSDRTSWVAADFSESVKHPSKLMKLDDGRTMFAGALNVSKANESALPNVLGVGTLSGKATHKSEDMHYSGKQISETQIPPEVDSALLQQVLSLPPEKLSLLPPEQREEVIKLQQRFRRDQIQPS